MKILTLVAVAIVVLLSLAAGGAKLASTPQEVQFFEAAGLGTAWLVPFGILQILGGLLAIPKSLRWIGATICAACFLASAAMVFATGQTSFGLISLLPVLLAGFVVWSSKTG